jgi:hypothetical protein
LHCCTASTANLNLPSSGEFVGDLWTGMAVLNSRNSLLTVVSVMVFVYQPESRLN